MVYFWEICHLFITVFWNLTFSPILLHIVCIGSCFVSNIHCHLGNTSYFFQERNFCWKLHGSVCAWVTPLQAGCQTELTQCLNYPCFCLGYIAQGLNVCNNIFITSFLFPIFTAYFTSFVTLCPCTCSSFYCLSINFLFILQFTIFFKSIPM